MIFLINIILDLPIFEMTVEIIIKIVIIKLLIINILIIKVIIVTMEVWSEFMIIIESNFITI